MNYLKLVRPLNLLLIFFTLVLMRFAIVEPLLGLYKLESKLPLLSFWLYCLSTVFIAAGGYVVNDIIDYKIDQINKPKRVIVNETVLEEHANNLFYFFYAGGLLLAIAASWLIGKIEFSFIYGIMALLLYYYNQELKMKPLVGNVVVAFSVAMVPMSLGLIEITQVNLAYSEEMIKNPRSAFYFQKIIFSILYWITGFSVFAFLCNLARELVKDIIDKEGDKCYGGNTLPISYGENFSKKILILLYVIIITGLVLVQQQYLFDSASTIYIGLLLAAFGGIGFLIRKATSKQDYQRISALNKLCLAYGLGYALVAYWNFTNI